MEIYEVPARDTLKIIGTERMANDWLFIVSHKEDVFWLLRAQTDGFTEQFVSVGYRASGPRRWRPTSPSGATSTFRRR